MVRAYAQVEPVPPLRLKGKRAPVRAWRLLSLGAPGAAREDDQAPLIGREEEARQLRQAYGRAARDRRCCVVTLLGLPGIGKSRLVRDFTRGLPAQTSVLVGRCPSYGAGITYRPIAEMLEALNGDWPLVAPELEPASVRALRGLAATDGTSGVEEIARAVRGLFEALARRRPLVVIWEDLHWAEPTLLDLIEQLAARLLDVPVLLVCVARPELLDLRPTWGGGMACAYALELGPLGPDEMRALVSCLAPPLGEVVAHGADPLLDRVAEGADGNPLFAELMLETLAEEGAGAPLPPTVQALIAARLDRLGGRGARRARTCRDHRPGLRPRPPHGAAPRLLRRGRGTVEPAATADDPPRGAARLVPVHPNSDQGHRVRDDPQGTASHLAPDPRRPPHPSPATHLHG
ncbi:AAA family ATPase [Nonomuraea salmonea]|uniref:AAA family ATPase n=1 Tax=Nonomuraea salmonea TaxID=46181 RepID=UPI002FE701C9